MKQWTHGKPVLFLLFAVGIAAISLSSILIRWSEAEAPVIAMYRLAITDVLLLPFLFRFRRQLSAITRNSWMLLALSGAMLALHFLFWMQSLRWTSVSSSTAIMTLEPVFVMLGSFWWFGQRYSCRSMIYMFLAVAGAALIGWGDFGTGASALQGDMYSLIGTAAVAVHMMIGQTLTGRMSALMYSFFVFLFASAFLALYNVVAGIPFTGYAPREWGLFVLLAIIPTVCGHYLFNWLLKYMKASSVSMSVLGEPVGATLLAYWLLGESITGVQLLAGMMVLAGVWLFLRTHVNPHSA